MLRTALTDPAAHAQGVEPFLKWPGGKRWLARLIAPVVNERLDGTYVEPFAGSSAVFLRTAPPAALLGDVNIELIETLETVAADPHAVVDAVWRFSNTADCFYRVRRSRPRTAVGRAARFIYLNRTAWGGVHRTNQHGEFNTPFGNSGRIICRRQTVTAASALLARASFHAVDFEKLVDRARAGDVVYADPPYVSTASERASGFQRYAPTAFRWADQQRLAEAAKRAVARGAFVLVSGGASSGVERLYEGWHVARFQRITRVSRHRKGRGPFNEIVMASAPIPDLSQPVEQAGSVAKRMPHA